MLKKEECVKNIVIVVNIALADFRDVNVGGNVVPIQIVSVDN